jgi:hypothetical protein
MKTQYIIETKDDTIPEEISITGSSLMWFHLKLLPTKNG